MSSTRIACMILAGLAGTFVSPLPAQQPAGPDCGLESSENSLREALIHSVRWYAFWVDEGIMSNVSESEVLPASAAVVGRKIVFCICGVGLEIHIALDPPGRVGRVLFVARISAEPCNSSRAELESYLKANFPLCKDTPAVPELQIRIIQPGDLPTEGEESPKLLPKAVPRSCVSQSTRDGFCRFDFSIRVPPLDTTYAEEIAGAEVRAETVEQFRELAKGYFPGTPMWGVVPRFSDKDPMVYVSLHLGSYRGILPMRREANGDWYCDKLILQAPKNNIDDILRRIESLAAAEFTIP